MADSSALAGLLDRAAKAFGLAGDLGSWLQESRESGSSDSAELGRRFAELVRAALDCVSLIQSPPTGCEEVSRVAGALKGWAEFRSRNPTSHIWNWLPDEWPELNSFADEGHKALKAARRAVEQQKWNPPQTSSVETTVDRSAEPTIGQGADSDLLLLLWDAPDREAGLAVVELPEHLRDETLLSACEGAHLVRFARRNHCYVGGQLNRLVLENGWNVAKLDQPNRKQAWQLVREALSEDVPDEIRLRVQLTREGTTATSRLALERRAGKPSLTAATGDTASFLEQLLAGPDDAELTPRELALLEAHLRQPISLEQMKREAMAGSLGKAVGRNKLKLIRDFNRSLRKANAPSASQQPEPHRTAQMPAHTAPIVPKPKRSTERGEGRSKLVAALTKHHHYADGGCLNLEPIGNNELARLADVSESTASGFFNKQFHGHTKYRALCGDAPGLVAALKLLNGEFSPHDLYGRRPTTEDGGKE